MRHSAEDRVWALRLATRVLGNPTTAAEVVDTVLAATTGTREVLRSAIQREATKAWAVGVRARAGIPTAPATAAELTYRRILATSATTAAAAPAVTAPATVTESIPTLRELIQPLIENIPAFPALGPAFPALGPAFAI